MFAEEHEQCNFLLPCYFCPHNVQIFSSTSCSRTPSIYILPSGRDNMKSYFNLGFYIADRKTKQNSQLNGSKHSQNLICSYFFMNVILMHYCQSQTLELCHIFRGFISHHCIMIVLHSHRVNFLFDLPRHCTYPDSREALCTSLIPHPRLYLPFLVCQ